MRFFPLILASGVIALSAVTVKNVSHLNLADNTTPESSELIARNGRPSGNAHRGSGRRRVLAISVPALYPAV